MTTDYLKTEKIERNKMELDNWRVCCMVGLMRVLMAVMTGEERMRLPVVRRPEGAWTQGVSQ